MYIYYWNVIHDGGGAGIEARSLSQQNILSTCLVSS